MTRLAVDELRRAANGRWFDVLTALGMPADSLTRANKPCPACGGADRFSFTDKNGSGSFVCRALDRQGGDGFELAMHWLGRDFRATLEAVAGALGGGAAGQTCRTAAPAAPRPSVPPRRKDAGEALRRVWRAARDVAGGDPVARYLAGRGLSLADFPAVIRHHPGLMYWHPVNGKPVRLGTFPAMLAAVQGADGRVVALHRTYLTPAGGKAVVADPATGKALAVKKLMTRDEQVMPGAAVRLYPPTGGRIALAEGIETALAVFLASGLPVWACVNAHGLATVRLPPDVAEVFIAADNDPGGTGQRAAQALADRMRQEGRQVEILTPSTPGADWLDVLNQAKETTP